MRSRFLLEAQFLVETGFYHLDSSCASISNVFPSLVCRPVKMQKIFWCLLLLHRLLAVAQNSSQASVASPLPFEINEQATEGDANYSAPIFPTLPFNKYPTNPILVPNPSSNFESANLYNPIAIGLNEAIFLLYRAQNASKTSSIGLAWSTN